MKRCLECREELANDFAIIFHECDTERKNNNEE